MIAKRDDAAVTVRFPKAVLEKVTRSAQANGRSRNTEIVVRLADALGVKTKKQGSSRAAKNK